MGYKWFWLQNLISSYIQNISKFFFKLTAKTMPGNLFISYEFQRRMFTIKDYYVFMFLRDLHGLLNILLAYFHNNL